MWTTLYYPMAGKFHAVLTNLLPKLDILALIGPYHRM